MQCLGGRPFILYPSIAPRMLYEVPHDDPLRSSVREWQRTGPALLRALRRLPRPLCRHLCREDARACEDCMLRKAMTSSLQQKMAGKGLLYR